MEEWEVNLETYPQSPDFRSFIKIIEVAGFVIKQDLAPFEFDWFLHTLLYKPVNLLSTVELNKNDTIWEKSIGDSFKLLADIASSLKEHVEKYFEVIVKLCNLSYESQIRRQSLHCLSRIAAVSSYGAEDAKLHVNMLEQSTICKAPLALLVGTICEHHPETVASDVNKIWRIYLNCLESNKNTDTLTQSFLLGILGLFKHFGSDLPLLELKQFYEKLSVDYIKRSRCQNVCLKILTHHSNLFRECIVKDSDLRTYLCWLLSDNPKIEIISAVDSVYRILCGPLLKEQILQIARNELVPLTHSARSQVKYTALKLISTMSECVKMDINIESCVDVQALEFELRNETVLYETAEAVSYCIQTKVANYDKLLQTAVLFYGSLPAERRKEIVVHGLLNADPILRTATTNFLISESTIDNDSLERFFNLWNDIFDTNNGQDYTVMDKCKYVFEDAMTYSAIVLENFLDLNEQLQSKLLSLLKLTAHIISLQSTEDYTADHCGVLMPILIDMQYRFDDVSIITCARSCLVHLRDRDLARQFVKNIRIDRCKDEVTLCESCLTLIQAPDEAAEVDSVLQALQIIFSRNDVEYSTLIKSLKKFEFLLANRKDDLDLNIVNNILNQLENLRKRNDIKIKDSRILHRDIVIFLGKYGNTVDCYNNLNIDLAITKLMSSLTLNIPNPDTGLNYKLNLQRILHLALDLEDHRGLQTLLSIICANLSPPLRGAVPRVCLAVARSYSRGNMTSSRPIIELASVCADATFCTSIVGYISEENSPGVRKMLADVLEAVIATQDDEVVMTVADHSSVMMISDDATTKRAGLSTSQILLTALKDNNNLTKILVPKMLVLISKTQEIDSAEVFDEYCRHFLEKIELYDNDSVFDVIDDLLDVLFMADFHKLTSNRSVNESEKSKKDLKSKLTPNEWKARKATAKMILAFIKSIFSYKNWDSQKFLGRFFEKEVTVSQNFFYVLAEMRIVFDFDLAIRRKVLSDKDCEVPNALFCMELVWDSNFCMESVLMFLEEYSELLLELQYNKTLELLKQIIENITPDCVKKVKKNIANTLSKFNLNNNKLKMALENWCDKQKFKEITTCLEKELFTEEHAVKVAALNVMLQAFKMADLSHLTAVKTTAKEWAKILLNLHSRDYIVNYLKSKMRYLTDLLTVSLKFTSREQIKVLLLEGSTLPGLPIEKIGVAFCRYFIGCFYDFLVLKPFVLLDSDATPVCVLIEDVVKYSLVKKRLDEDYKLILELVDEIWPVYSSQKDFNEKLVLLQDLSMFPVKLARESKPMQWAVEAIDSDHKATGDKARLICVLPGGNEFSTSYRTFASCLPIRLSEMRGDALSAFRCILDALSATGDLVLMDIVMTLADGDETEGWWDEAIDSCMASLAAREDSALYKAAYARTGDLTLGSCRRVLVPLLRYAKPSFCERFFSEVIKDLLAAKEFPTVTSNYKYHKALVDYTRRFILLGMAFEKLSPAALESPTSQLYCDLKPKQSWYLVRETCKVCVSSRTKVTLVENASQKFVKDYRLFHCENYNCLSAAICRIKPEIKKYIATIFIVDVWDKLLDQDGVLDVKIRQQWNYRKQRKSTAISIENASVSLSGSRTATVRTKMFLRTLSENVMMYDLIQNEDEQIQTQELQLPSNPLNDLPNASNLTALMCHMLTVVGEEWIDQLISGLRQGQRYTRWLLAQVICNCKEDLKGKASALRPALLDVIASTPVEYKGKTVLNGLHIDIFETLILWGDTNPESSDDLNKCLELMLNTILEHRIHDSIYRTLTDVLNKFLNIYNSCVDVSLDFKPYLADEEATKTLDVLRIVAKNKIKVPNLLATLLDKMETKEYYKLLKMAELFGLALNCCDDRQTYLMRFKKVLDQLRKSNVGEYIKMLYYAQNASPSCCDEHNYRQITDLAPKISGPEKAKCLNILSTFLSNGNPSNHVKDVFNSMDLPEIVLSDNETGLKLVKSGLSLLKDGAKRMIVSVSSEFCKSSLVKVRRVAFEVMVAAFEDLMSSAMLPPASKRAKIATTQIIKYVEDTDVYIRTVFKFISIGVIDSDEIISSSVRDGVAKYLNKYDLGLRFTECFLLSTYLPILNADKKENLSVCSSALLDMLLEDLMNQERFKVIKLSEEPLVIRQTHTGFTKLLSMSKTYQGTFRSDNLTKRSKHSKSTGEDDNGPAIDVQITIENILKTFLQLSKDHPAISQALCLEFVKALPGIEPRSAIADALVILLRKTTELTPFVIELCEMFVEDICLVDGIQDSVLELKSITRNTEGERLVRNLCNDVLMRKIGDEYFVLGQDFCDETYVMMMGDDEEYCIDDVSTAFKKLSNWDSLTIKDRKNVLSCGLPTLWTDNEAFKLKLDEYTPAMDWFGKLCSAYKGEGREECMKWLRSLDQWPRCQFEVSAIVEAIEWLSRDERTDLVFNMQREDCLVEWSARLMIRVAHLGTKDYESKQDDVMLSRSHELLWCKRANEMELPSLVMSCAARNTPDLYERETLGWLHEKLFALRTTAGINDDTSKLKKVLDAAEKYTPDFADLAKIDDFINMNTLMLKLNMDLKLQNVNVANVHVALDELIRMRSDEGVNKDGIDTFYQTAVQYLASCWNDSNKEETLSHMIDILHRIGNADLANYGILSMVLNKLYDCQEICMEEEVADKLLNQIQRNYADDFVTSHLSQLKDLFPSRSLAKYSSLWERDGDTVAKYKKCLQLVCDPDYSLLQYCDGLVKVLEGNSGDAQNSWCEIFTRIKGKLFENPFAGSDFKLLNRYKSKLYEIYPYEDSSNFKTKAKNTLQEVIQQLKYKNPQNKLKLSQLCPDLAKMDGCPAKLFGLPDKVGVVKIYEQIPVFTDSIRRPALLKLLLTNGQNNFFLHKSGENLANDAAAQSIARYAGRLWKGRCKIVTYNVTQLSDDCGLIEYLEDHERLRDLVNENCNLTDVVNSIRRPVDSELIITPIQSNLHCYKQFCNRVPSNCLKNAICKRSLTQIDFLIKINNFEETVASSTIITWLLGLGDRHLENILYSRNGDICHIDWGAVFQYGSNEIPAARLTRNVLAVCHTKALEARLQQLLTILKDSRILFSAVLDMTLKFIHKDMTDTSSHAKSILEGEYVTFDKLKSFDNLRDYVKLEFKQLLNNVFENFEYKNDVESQIKHLILLSTDPRILSVTRSGWEPWV